jgi:hypothetical protein
MGNFKKGVITTKSVSNLRDKEPNIIALTKEIKEGIESGISKNFDPKKQKIAKRRNKF